MTPNKHSIAVVDSNSVHRNQVKAALMSFYDITVFEEGKTALRDLGHVPPALIVVNEDLKPSGAPDFIRALRDKPLLKNVPVLQILNDEDETFITLAKAAGATGHISRPYRRSMLIHAISQQLNASIEDEWEALAETPKEALKQSVGTFNAIGDMLMTGKAVEFKNVKSSMQPMVEAIENNDFKSILNGVRNHDDYTYAHSMRVATLLSLLGHAAGFKNDEQLMLASGGLLHDVGKMKIPHNILNKPGKLTASEFETMKSHVPETMEYLKQAGDIPQAVLIIAEQHHEKLNGMGYPKGLKGKELNELARMAAIVDVFSALTDRRVYKPPMAPEEAMRIMTEEMGDHLDMHFVKLFRTIMADAKVLE